MLEEIEDAIDGLPQRLREALLLGTRLNSARSAAILGVSQRTHREREREAKQRVVDKLLGEEEWQDPEVRSALAMYIDGAAIRMERRQERPWRVWAALGDAVTPLPRLRLSVGVVGAVGVLVLAAYVGSLDFGALLRRGASDDSKEASTATARNVGRVSDGVGSGGSGGGVGNGGAGTVVVGMDPASSDGAPRSEATRRFGNATAVPRDAWKGGLLQHDYSMVRERVQEEVRRSSELAHMYRDLEISAREMESACGENHWEGGGGTEGAGVDRDVGELEHRREELERQREELERQREDIEAAREELEQSRVRIEGQFRIKGRAYEEAFREYMEELLSRYVDALELRYNAGLEKDIGGIQEGYYAAFDGCARRKKVL